MNWEHYKNKIKEQGNLPEDWYILGIDLGTTNSIISYWDNNSKSPEPIDISNGFGKIPLSSVVQFRDHDDGESEWIIGEEAYRSMKIYPETTIRSIKRKMGTNETVKLDGKDYLPEELSAMILKELLNQCKNINPKAEIVGVVVSVPYDFDDAAKKATRKACDLAGLKDKLISLIEEPKAACLAYNFRHKILKDEKLMVFDFGGGTLDITIFDVVEQNDNYIKLQVISEGGEAYHGGDNVDDLVLDKCYEFIKNKTNQDKKDLAIENQVELIMRSIETKERLSGIKSYRIPFTFCTPPFVEQITREKFEDLISGFIDKTRKLVLQALRETYTGSLSPNDVTRVLLEGGSSQMNWVKDMLLGIFNDENKIYVSEKPALDISVGATYYAAMKMGLLLETQMDTEKMTVEFEVSVPHDIGLEIENHKEKIFFPMIRRGTPYPLAKKSHVFTLYSNNEEEMTVFDLKILERINKNDSYEDTKLIGEIAIKGLPKRPSGKTKLEITLNVDEEGGLVKGYIEDLGSGDNEYPASDFKEKFDPDRFEKTVLER